MRTEDYSPRQKWDQRLNLVAGSIEGIVHGIPEWRKLQLGEISTSDYEQALAVVLKLSIEEIPDLLRDFYSGDRLDEQLISLIRRLHAAAIPVGLLSNNPASLRDELIRLRVLNLFSPCIISAEIGALKPDASAYQACLFALHMEPHHALMIDDSPANVEGALTLGMRAIEFKSSFDLETELLCRLAL